MIYWGKNKRIENGCLNRGEEIKTKKKSKIENRTDIGTHEREKNRKIERKIQIEQKTKLKHTPNKLNVKQQSGRVE